MIFNIHSGSNHFQIHSISSDPVSVKLAVKQATAAAPLRVCTTSELAVESSRRSSDRGRDARQLSYFPRLATLLKNFFFWLRCWLKKFGYLLQVHIRNVNIGNQTFFYMCQIKSVSLRYIFNFHCGLSGRLSEPCLSYLLLSSFPIWRD